MIHPDMETVDALLQQGDRYRTIGEVAQAITCYSSALQQEPNRVSALTGLAMLLIKQEKFQEAEALLQQAITNDPQAIAAYIGLSDIAHFRNDKAQAHHYNDKILEIDPGFAPAYYKRASLEKYSDADDPLIATIHNLLDNPSHRTTEHTAYLHFALGKLYNDCGCYDQAFEQYHQGNALYRNTVRYNPQGVDIFIDRLIACYGEWSKVLKEKNIAAKASAFSPLFVVGMPRSGTSLVEQILSAHPAVDGAGEVMLLHARIQQHIKACGEVNPYNMEEAKLQTTRNDYLEELSCHVAAGGKSRYVIDKMPQNIFNVGHIAQFFPQAKIIHCLRDPMDTCLSNYFRLFAGGNTHSYQLEELAAYYCAYRKMAAYWQEVAPLPMLEVDYDALVHQPEAEIRKMLEFLELEWDDACMSPEANDKVVRTSSAWQVRQPIYQSSSQRWKHYDRYLLPLKIGLGEYYSAWGQDSDVLMQRGELYLKQGDGDKAIHAFEQGWTLERSPAFAIRLAGLYVKVRQDIPSAIVMLQEVAVDNRVPDATREKMYQEIERLQGLTQ